MGLMALVPNSVDVHFVSGSTWVTTPLPSITSIPDVSDPLEEDESSTVYFENNGILTASTEVHCTIALEFPREISSFPLPPASPMTRAQIRPFSTETIVFPSAHFWRETRVLESRRTIDLSANMSEARESAVV